MALRERGVSMRVCNGGRSRKETSERAGAAVKLGWMDPRPARLGRRTEKQASDELGAGSEGSKLAWSGDHNQDRHPGTRQATSTASSRAAWLVMGWNYDTCQGVWSMA